MACSLLTKGHAADLGAEFSRRAADSPDLGDLRVYRLVVVAQGYVSVLLNVVSIPEAHQDGR